MLLFQKRFHAGLKSGTVTVTYRHWQTARVKPKGRYRCHPIGVLEVDEVTQVTSADITQGDARLAGFDSRSDLLSYLSRGRKLSDDSKLFRIAFHYGGDGDRIPLALEADLSAQDVETITKKLARLDQGEPWTLPTLRIIEKHPQVAARILATKLGRERDPFKVDVRKLKRLGLTQSFEIGYEISPRGRAYLDAIRTRS